MKITKGLIAGIFTLVTAVGVGVKKITDKRKVKKAKEINPYNNEGLLKTYEAFRKECLRNEVTAMKAVRLMNNLQDELDEKNGIDPTTINVYIEDTIFEGKAT